MVTITESARKALKNILDAEETQPGQSLRLVEEQGKHRLTVGIEQEGDQVVEHKGETVLLIGPDIGSQLESFVLDLWDTPEGSRLAITPKKEDN